MDDEKYLEWLRNSKISDWPQNSQNEFIEHYDKRSDKIFDSQSTTGHMYIRHLIFMNGGALVAMLSATAALMTNKVKNIEWTWDSMFWFFLGLVIAASLNGSVYLRYIAHGNKYHKFTDRFLDKDITFGEREEVLSTFAKHEKWWMGADIVLGAFGLLFFIFGFLTGICQLAKEVGNPLFVWVCAWI